MMLIKHGKCSDSVNPMYLMNCGTNPFAVYVYYQ